ncbi:MAG: ABC transporter substrate-binding protein [Chloroflexota bacterium]|nr:MAG: ABC transporter substrate-binding protein [Chloroflexota bacterium]
MFDRRSRVWSIPGAFISAILVITLLAACGGSQSTPQSPQPSASTKASESSKPAESAKPSASPPASAQSPVKIGVILTTSGAQGAIGAKQVTGLEMATEEINAAGGIMGRKIELIQRDDGGDPTKALTAAQELVEKNGVSIIIASTLSSPALAIAPYLTEQKVLMLGTHSADAVNNPAKYPYEFTGSPTSTQQAGTVAKYAVEVLKAKKIAILGESSAYGNSTVPAYKAQLEKRNVQPVAVEQYPQGTQDMTAQLTTLRKAGAEAILGATLAADSVRIIKNILSMGWDVPYLGNSDLSSSAVVEGVGVAGMEKVYPYSYKNLSISDKVQIPAKTKEYADKLAKKLNQNPLKDSIEQSALLYDEMYMIKKAIEDAKSTDGPKLAAALEAFTGYSGVLATFKFSKDNHGGIDLDNDMVMVKGASFKNGFYQLAPGY